MRNVIKDLTVIGNGSKKRCLVNLFLGPNFHAVLNYRIARFFYKCHLEIIAKMIHYVNRTKYSVDIDYRADLAGGFHLVHGIGVVIGRDVVSEGPIKIYQNVTLGGNKGKKRTENGITFTQPRLKANSIIYANSVVIGPVIVGENAICGASSVITSDIAPNTTVFNKSEKIIIDRIRSSD